MSKKPHTHEAAFILNNQHRLVLAYTRSSQGSITGWDAARCETCSVSYVFGVAAHFMLMNDIKNMTFDGTELRRD